jgi:hypothetical protein
VLSDEDADHVSHGRRIPFHLESPTALFAPGGSVLALAESEGDCLRYLAVFVG